MFNPNSLAKPRNLLKLKNYLNQLKHPDIKQTFTQNFEKRPNLRYEKQPLNFSPKESPHRLPTLSNIIAKFKTLYEKFRLRFKIP